MTTSAPAVAPQRTVSTQAWLAMALAFVIGTASGAVAMTAIADRPVTASAPTVALAPTQAEVTSLVEKAELAASRGDVRLYLQFRDDLAASVGSAETAEQLTDAAVKADAAMRRGDIRLAIQFRENLAASIAALAEGE